MENMGFTLIGLAILVFFVLGIINVLKNITLGKETNNWPLTEGAIVCSKVIDCGNKGSPDTEQCRPNITYKYQVGGREYISNRISVGEFHCVDEDEAIRATNKYQVANKVSVYYDPVDPSLAVLERGF